MTNQKKKVGVGWSKTSQDGTKEFVSIVIHGGISPDINLVMFRNGFKEKENQPDYIIYLNPPKPASGAPVAAAAKPAATATPEDFPEDGGGDDGIPF